jgi:hypothetical protein
MVSSPENRKDHLPHTPRRRLLQPEDFKDFPLPRRRHRKLVPVLVAMTTLTIGSAFVVARVEAAGASVWVQTMDSCREALGGASYQITNSSGTYSANVTTPSGGPTGVGGGQCPLERGDCASMSTGCVQFTGLPFPDKYRIRETATPPANHSNPQGYAPCEGGSACQGQWADVTIDGAGNVSSVTTNVEPDGTVQHFPSSGSASGAAGNPVVFHDYGLGSGSCDGDNDADDHGTGSGPGAHCGYPEGSESSTRQPYPWSGTCGGGCNGVSSPPPSSSKSSSPPPPKRKPEATTHHDSDKPRHTVKHHKHTDSR